MGGVMGRLIKWTGSVESDERVGRAWSRRAEMWSWMIGWVRGDVVGGLCTGG